MGKVFGENCHSKDNRLGKGERKHGGVLKEAAGSKKEKDQETRRQETYKNLVQQRH